MRTFTYILCGVVLVACSHAAGPSTIPPGPASDGFARKSPSATNYGVLYSFGGVPDGASPYAGLIAVGHQLYGTTEAGGKGSKPGYGTIFNVKTAGTGYNVLHSFGGGDGAIPYGSLTDVNGTLYGTTSSGGRFNFGAFFGVSTTGTVQVLHSFGSGNDGSTPYAGLINVNGTLYGTASGGPTLKGVVFSVSTTGSEHVLYNFVGGYGDGEGPHARLYDLNGTLYGTTLNGGTNDNGTVFSVSTTGTEHLLHSFGSGDDGTTPYSNVIAVNGTLYGTTKSGGAKGFGTVFSLSTSGKEKVLHSFGGPPNDGASPYAGLIDVKVRPGVDVLYSTTFAGGKFNGGTVFSFDLANKKEQVLHSFSAEASVDGAQVYAGLVNVGGQLYGTTFGGGTYGDGTVFVLAP